jgi:hypothetical protein
MAWYYNTNGECLTATTIETLKNLLKLSNTDVAAAAEFKALLCKTAATHAGRFEDPSYRPKIPSKNQNFALQPHILDSLINATNVDTNWLSDLTLTTSKLAKFCTATAIDNKFGTTTTAYSCHWKGKGLIIPNNNQEDVAHALKWAILSTAKTEAVDVPTYTLLLCTKPEDPLAGLNKFIQHPSVCTLLQLSQPPIIPQISWRKNAPHPPIQNTPPLLVLAIANEPGYHQLAACTNHLKQLIHSLSLPFNTKNTKTTSLETALQAWLPKLQHRASTSSATLGLVPSKQFKNAHANPPFLSTNHVLNSTETADTYISSLPTTKNLKFASTPKAAKQKQKFQAVSMIPMIAP